MAGQTFAELQAQFRSIWPTVTLRSIGDVKRTVVVVHSISFDIPDQLMPVFTCVRGAVPLPRPQPLAGAPQSRVIYVTSQPIHPRVLDYYSRSSPSSTRRGAAALRSGVARRRS